MERQPANRRQRRRIFVGCEGDSESGYAAFIGILAEEAGLPVHLDIQNLRSGDPLAVVERAVKRCNQRRTRRGEYVARSIFLDADRRYEQPKRAVRADRLLSENGFHAIWSTPVLEALLLMHFTGCEQLQPPTSVLARSQLLDLWPDYGKGMTAMRLDGASVARAARVVSALRMSLDSISPGFLLAR